MIPEMYITMQGQGDGGHIPEEEIGGRIMATCMSTGVSVVISMISFI